MLHKQPVAPNRLNPELPPAVSALILKCLQKDPRHRYTDAAALRTELKRALRQSEGGSADLPGFARSVTARPRRLPTLLWVLVFLVVVAGMWILVRRDWSVGPAAAPHLTFRQITDQPGQELYPSLSPDGKTLVYASAGPDRSDIFLRRVDGANAIKLTAQTGGGGTQPAYSPDGERIAFRGAEGGGGIFVMGATGETVRRVTGRGFHPAWSPDGKWIVYCTQEVVRPESHDRATSDLWLVNPGTGEERKFLAGDAMQPSWSPNGHRIAYWAVSGDQTGIWTVPAPAADRAADGGANRVLVFAGAGANWNPVWSPDGRYLIFPSDRGGSMNLWRIRIDERTGKPEGDPQALTTPSVYSGHLSFSRDGKRMAYVQHNVSVNVARFEFDDTGRIAPQPVWLTRGAKKFREPDVSPDGRSLVMQGDSGGSESLFFMRANGSDLRPLPEGQHAEQRGSRFPAWSPDGRAIAFQSAAPRLFWIVKPDGSGLRQVSTAGGADVLIPVWSPNGDRLAYSRNRGETVVVDAAKPAGTPPLIVLPPMPQSGEWFVVTSWSPDGKRLAGHLLRASGLQSGVLVYDLKSGAYETIVSHGSNPRWLRDNHRLVFSQGDRLYVVDAVSRSEREIAALQPLTLGSRLSPSPDGRYLYLSAASAEADVWLASFE
jgi:Tol biopolymer transport system component